jgi:CRISPR type IV-associated protein Csf3
MPVVSIDLLNLDGILAYGMVRAVWGSKPFPTSDSPFWLPLPLGYTEHAGLPLWQATCLFPVGTVHQDSTHYHKRTDANPYSFPAIMGTLGQKRPRRQPNTAAGQYMNYRIPEPYTVAESWQATCLGNREEVTRLLGYVSGLGKDLAQGYGRVLDWQVEPLDEAFTWITEDGEVLRPFPTEDSFGVLAAWTPPYWRRDLWLPCRVPSLTGLPSA